MGAVAGSGWDISKPSGAERATSGSLMQEDKKLGLREKGEEESDDKRNEIIMMGILRYLLLKKDVHGYDMDGHSSEEKGSKKEDHASLPRNLIPSFLVGAAGG